MPSSPYFAGLLNTESVEAPLSRGVLTSVSVLDDFPATSFQNCLNVTVFLVRAKSAQTSRITVLCGGFVDSIQSPSWHGAIEVNEDDILIGRGNGANSATVRIAYTQLTLTAKGAIYQYVKQLLSA